mmetsp:Transcript_15945/g.32967  ORF Transcript_15945/g.32967 Transcript_15945/m.32967 type:complete len:208 (-) Transcript_15945:276-899(-)
MIRRRTMSRFLHQAFRQRHCECCWLFGPFMFRSGESIYILRFTGGGSMDRAKVLIMDRGSGGLCWGMICRGCHSVLVAGEVQKMGNANGNQHQTSHKPCHPRDTAFSFLWGSILLGIFFRRWPFGTLFIRISSNSFGGLLLIPKFRCGIIDGDQWTMAREGVGTRRLLSHWRRRRNIEFISHHARHDPRALSRQGRWHFVDPWQDGQ